MSRRPSVEVEKTASRSALSEQRGRRWRSSIGANGLRTPELPEGRLDEIVEEMKASMDVAGRNEDR
ncbi:MAG: hypothetical protein R3304_06760 [Longimicrobiales bacterium]|nr:hypothetical protein [Longimicrobiales bacterium]